MTTLTKISRHWSRQTEKRRGIRLDAAAMDILNAIGVGELLHLAAAEGQREECEKRRVQNHSIAETTSVSMPLVGGEPTLKSSGMIPLSVGNEALARVQRRLNMPA
jgi:hypothetical protein